MSNDLAKLNRLRVNAGKAELKSWKASQAKLDEQITKLEAEGFLDVLPGANVEASPAANDDKKDSPDLSNVEAAGISPKGVRVMNGKPSLARGLDTDGYARHSRKAVQDHRAKEKKDKKASKVKLSDKDKKQIKDEAASRGKVDPKKDPEKAKRQEKHIAEKRAKREAEGKLKPIKEKDPNIVTAADLARELDIDPKVARAKLRRHKDKIEKIVKGWDGNWEFPKKAADGIKKILRSEK